MAAPRNAPADVSPESRGPRQGLRQTVATIPQRQRLASAAVVFLFASLIAYAQFSDVYQWHEPFYKDPARWVWRPLDWNVDSGLPDLPPLNDVTVMPNAVWVAGGAGFLAWSADEGRAWTQAPYDASTGVFSASPPPVTSTRPAAATRFERAVTPVLHASAFDAGHAQQGPPPKPNGSQGPAQSVKGDGSAARPTIAVTPGLVDFGDVAVGDVKDAQVTFTVTFPGASYGEVPTTPSTSGAPFSIPVNGCQGVSQADTNRLRSCAISVRFSASRQGDQKGELRWNEIAIPLVARGVAVAAGKGGPAQSPVQQGPPPAKAAPQAPSGLTVQTAPPTSGGATPGRIPQSPALLKFGACLRTDCQVLADGGVSFVTNNAGATWTLSTRALPPAADLSPRTVPGVPSRSFAFESGAIVWRVSDKGALLRSTDGGRTWTPITRAAVALMPNHHAVTGRERYGRFLPPWYILALIGLFLFVAVDEPPVEVATEVRLPSSPGDSAKRAVADRPLEPDAAVRHRDATIGNYATADKPLEPGEPDALGLGVVANGLSFFLRNDRTKPPLVLAINGRWGSGKSSLMNLLQKNLEGYGTQPVWFNAWHHQKEEQLLAALLQAVKAEAIPPLSSSQGWSFRARLAASRLPRYWAQVSIGVAVVVLVWYAEARLERVHVSVGDLLRVLLHWTQPVVPAAAESGAVDDAVQSFRASVTQVIGWIHNTSVVALVTGLVAVFRTLSHALRGFASDPSSLLASDAGGTSPKALQAQNSFRQQFAEEFRDVTKALGPNRRMLILIDDLDRCRPEKVREVLEAVNFLVSSGDCFVVLGMAREIVEHCVGLSFRHVVDSMPWTAFDLTDDDRKRAIEEAEATTTVVPRAARGGDLPAAPEIAAKRTAFARLFLDKLIQIELSVPEPTEVQKAKLFETQEDRREKERAEARVARIKTIVKTGARVLAPVAQVAIAATFLVGAGLQAGRFVLAPGSPQPSTRPAGPAAAALVPNQAATTPEPAAALAPVAAVVAPHVTPAAAPAAGFLSAWPFYFVIFVAAAAALKTLGRVPQQAVTDDKLFTNALIVWYPLVLTTGAHNTPRAARRFQNRVRYLAMRQRALLLDPPLPLGERWLRKLLAVPPARHVPPVRLPDADIDEGALPEVAAQLRDGNVYVPEPILVALAAIHEFEAQWIQDDGAFEQVVEGTKRGSGGARAETLAKALKDHDDAWGAWHNLEYYRRAYLRLSSEVDRPKTS